MAMLAKRVPRGHVVGLDLWRTEDQSGNNPEVTRRNLIAEGVAERCEVKTGDMLAMPFPDRTFDLVVSCLAIHNIDERDLRNHARRLQAVSEAVRVLKPGGRLVITDLLWTRRYAEQLRRLGMREVEQRSLGWRFWYAPFLGADLVAATKPRSTDTLQVRAFGRLQWSQWVLFETRHGHLRRRWKTGSHAGRERPSRHRALRRASVSAEVGAYGPEFARSAARTSASVIFKSNHSGSKWPPAQVFISSCSGCRASAMTSRNDR